MADLSKLTIGGVTNSFQDAYVQSQLDVLNGIVSGGISVVLVDSLPANPGAANMGKIYFVPSNNEHAQTPNGGAEVYDEYIVRFEEGVYSWEKIGTIDIDLSNYSLIGHKHTITPNVTIEKATYIPAGTVTLPGLVSTPTKDTQSVFKVTAIGTDYTLTPGASSRASDVTSDFATNGKLAAYNGSTLELTDAIRSKAVTTSGTYNYISPVIKTGAMPTFGTSTVLADITNITTTPDSDATFEGVQADILPTINSNTVDLEASTK